MVIYLGCCIELGLSDQYSSFSRQEIMDSDKSSWYIVLLNNTKKEVSGKQKGQSDSCYDTNLGGKHLFFLRIIKEQTVTKCG